VVARSADHRNLIGNVVTASAPPQQLVVDFNGADVLWVGFVQRDRIKDANTVRDKVRKILAQLETSPCTAGEPTFPTAGLLPDYSADAWPIAEAPPRVAGNQLPPSVAALAPSEPTTADATGRERIPIVALQVATIRPHEPAPAPEDLSKYQPPSQEELAKYLQAIGHRVGAAFEVVTLPWVEDAGAVISSAPAGDDDPRVGGLLEMLARTSARTLGRENALWIAVLAGDDDVGVASTADAARGIGVASRAGLARCITAMLDDRDADKTTKARSRPRASAKAKRLRLIGRLAGNALELLEPPREELRSAGRGAPEDSGVVAVALDRAGAELSRTKIRGHRSTLPSTFAALIPISPEVDVVELRRGHLVLTRVERATDEPTPARLTLGTSDGRATATWTMPTTARPISLTVEISDRSEGDDWVPFTTVHGCAEQGTLPLWRSSGAQRVRLVACDGWAAIPSEPEKIPEGVLFGPLVIRRVNERTLWAELPSSTRGKVDWFTLVRHTRDGRRLDLTTTTGGEVRLKVDQLSLVDTIDLEHRDVYRRA
jgi:hypothetical protein